MTGNLDTGRRTEMLRRMLLMRRLETMIELLAHDHPFGHYHLYIGQEATGAGVMEAVGPGDLLATTHRNHGHIVARGGEPGRVIAELMGRADGLNGGLGGTLHVNDRTRGFLSTSAIVGGSIGIATGGAHALKRNGQRAISVALFGDGALQEGIAFECLNMAALWGLPVLYVCENNNGPYVDGVPPPHAHVMAARRLTDIAAALGIATETVDGGDPEAVFGVAADAAERVRGGSGPVFIEAVTTPPPAPPGWPDLSTGAHRIEAAWDGSADGWAGSADPVLRYARTLLDAGVVDKDALVEHDRWARETIEAARAFAEASPFPDPSRALDGALV